MKKIVSLCLIIVFVLIGATEIFAADFSTQVSNQFLFNASDREKDRVKNVYDAQSNEIWRDFYKNQRYEWTVYNHADTRFDFDNAYSTYGILLDDFFNKEDSYAELYDIIRYAQRNEFDLLLANDGKSIITQTDEFGKTFLDYLVEYHSENGVRYLYEEYGIKVKQFHNQFEFKKDTGVTWINFQNIIEFARLVASMNDVELFNNIYDSYYMFFAYGYYAVGRCIFVNNDFLELILDNDDIFKSMFEEKTYVLELGNIAKRKKQIESITYRSINPIINNCLGYALKHLDKYKQRAMVILKFGIDYNRKKLSSIDLNDCYICNELGALRKYNDNNFCELIIFADIETHDAEIKSLISALPRFNKR